MSDTTNPLFQPFVPPTPEAPMPFAPPPEQVPVKPKRTRKPRQAKVAAPAKSKAATKRKPRPPKQPVAPEQETRPRSLDLQTILRATSGLKEEDYAIFEKFLNMDVSQRERIMVAISKVFA